MTLVTFTNPKTAGTYVWEVNPAADNEQPLSKQRVIERISNTANVGATKQQGDDGPLILDWQINVPTTAMETVLWEWYMLSKVQTIYVTDWEGEEYEGQIITLSRARKVANPPYRVCQLQFEIYRCISGVLATAGVAP
jgi:hypothetical protein